MGLMDKAKQAAEQAKAATAQAMDQAKAGHAAQSGGMSTGQDLKRQLTQAGRWGRTSLSTLVEKIDPGLLADLIIKATAAQEKANEALKAKESVYRVAEINITATIPPQIGFAVSRVGDIEEELTGHESESTDLLAAGSADMESPVVSLAGDEPLEDIIEAQAAEMAED